MNIQRKKILSSAFIFILAIIVIISVQTYCESNNVVVYGNDIEIPINQEGIFYVNVSGIDDLAFLTINITWDPAVITVSEVNDTNSDFDVIFSEIHANQGRVRIDAYSFDEPLNGDNIVVCRLICEATDTADIGDSCNVLFENSILWNSTGNEVEHISQAAIVNITEDDGGNVVVFIDDEDLKLNEEGLSLINITGVEKLAFVTLEIVWDPAVIKINEINDTVSDFDLVFSNLNTNSGHLSLQAYRFDNVGISGNVVICGLDVKPADQAVVGDSTVLDINKSILWNVSINTLDHVKNNGTISLVEAQSSNTDDVNLYANDITMPIDETGLVHVNLSTLSSVGYIILNISWDPAVVTLDDINDTISEFDMVLPYQSNDHVRIDAYYYGSNGITGNKILCGLEFSSADGSVVDDTSSIIFTDVQVYDNNSTLLPQITDDGSITLAEATNDGGNDNDGDDDTNNNGGGTSGGSTGGGGGVPPPVIVENTDPVAVIEVSSKVEFIDTAISFDASKSTDEDDDTLTYHWDFGDGSESTSMKTTHSYSTPDVYLVTLTVDDGQGGSDTASVDISINPPGNNPPSQLMVTEDTTNTHQNTAVSFSAVAIDEDENDTIRYVFDWDDGTEKTISDYMNSSISYETTHQWSSYGKYIVKVLAEDNENARSETVRITMLIDIKEIGGEINGWLIDSNSDGVYDSFKDLETNKISAIENVNDTYCLIDSDNDSSWDYEINLETNVLTPYSEKQTNAEDDSGILYLLGLVIVVFIILIVLLNRKKPSSPEEKKSSEKKTKKQK